MDFGSPASSLFELGFLKYLPSLIFCDKTSPFSGAVKII